MADRMEGLVNNSVAILLCFCGLFRIFTVYVRLTTLFYSDIHNLLWSTLCSWVSAEGKGGFCPPVKWSSAACFVHFVFENRLVIRQVKAWSIGCQQETGPEINPSENILLNCKYELHYEALTKKIRVTTDLLT